MFSNALYQSYFFKYQSYFWNTIVGVLVWIELNSIKYVFVCDV